jgi:hypothetical protein
MKRLKFIFLSAFIFTSASLFSFDFLAVFLHSEIAPKNSVFADAGPAPLVFAGLEFNVLPLDIRVEYMLPTPLPFSLGVFLKTPYPNLNSFGTRIGYHLNLFDLLTDFYFVYSFDFGFLRNDALKFNDDDVVDIHWYDFRFGARHFFTKHFGAAVETGFKFKDVIFLISFKIY